MSESHGARHRPKILGFTLENMKRDDYESVPQTRHEKDDKMNSDVKRSSFDSSIFVPKTTKLIEPWLGSSRVILALFIYGFFFFQTQGSISAFKYTTIAGKTNLAAQKPDDFELPPFNQTHYCKQFADIATGSEFIDWSYLPCIYVPLSEVVR